MLWNQSARKFLLASSPFPLTFAHLRSVLRYPHEPAPLGYKKDVMTQSILGMTLTQSVE